MSFTEKVVSKLWALAILGLLCSMMSTRGVLERQVHLQTFEGTVEQALDKISEKGDCHFSYNPLYIEAKRKVKLAAATQSIALWLDQLFGVSVRVQVNGQHVVLMPGKKNNQEITTKQAPPSSEKKAVPQRYVISGTVTNAQTGETIAQATVFDSDKLLSTLTNQEGQYALSVDAKQQVVPLAVSKADFYDTVVVVQPRKGTFNIDLRPISPATTDLPLNTPKLAASQNTVNDKRIVQIIVPDNNLSHTQNLGYALARPAQISFLPFLGTNHTMSGNAINKFSVNVLAGYSAGTKGLELGGLLNINRISMKGVQLAGFGNVTGGRVKGLQAAGFFNYNMGSTKGLQLAGFQNVILDSLSGLQAAGFVNVLHGNMVGLQAAGFANITTYNASGLQASGFGNVCLGDVSALQAAGFANYSRKVSGAQMAGFANVSLKDVRGLQMAGFANASLGNVEGLQMAGFTNLARDLDKMQLSGLGNVAMGKVQGLQLAGFGNFAYKLDGVQIGLFNYADSVTDKSVAIGLLSLARRGGHHSLGLHTTEFGMQLAQLQLGVRRFYNIFGIGTTLGLGEQTAQWAYQYGVGSRRDLGKRWGVALEATAMQILNRQSIVYYYNQMLTAECQLQYRLSSHWMLHAGVAYRQQVKSTLSDADFFAPYALTSWQTGTLASKTWIGGNLGIRYCF